MLPAQLQRLGQIYRPWKAQFYNRTGATMTKGMGAMMDILDTEAEVTNASASGSTEGAVDSPMATLTAIATAGLNTFPILLCADASVADNAVGNYIMSGLAEMSVGDDDVTTNDIDKGDPITPLNGVTYFGEAVTTNRCVGTALEDAAASSATTARTVDANAHLRWVIFNGTGHGCGWAL